MIATISPLAPTSFPVLPEIEGVRFATGAAGIRYKDRTDVMLALFDKGTQAGGVFTKSKCPSAPVDWCRARLKGGKARALLVNSGNANAFTGKSGSAGGEIRRRACCQGDRRVDQREFFSPRPASSASRSMRRNSTACSKRLRARRPRMVFLRPPRRS